MKTVLSIALTLLAVAYPAPHEFEDGFVERTFAIVIRDNLATAEYSIALNESTLKEILDQWQSPEVGQTPKNKQPSLETATIKPDAGSGPLIAPAEGSLAKSHELDQLKTERDKTEARLNQPEKSASAPSVHSDEAGREDLLSQIKSPGRLSSGFGFDLEKTAQSTNDPGSQHLDAPIPEELLALLNKQGPSQIAGQIVITCNGQSLKIKNVSAAAAPRHPFNLIVKFEFEIPDLKSAKLKIQDHNFLQYNGAIRNALKTRGSSMLVRSDTAPIIVRAQRHELKGLSQKEASTRTSISADILIMSKLNKEN